MYIYVPCTCLVSVEAEEGIGSPETGVTDGCELSRGWWELNSGPLEKEQALLTTE